MKRIPLILIGLLLLNISCNKSNGNQNNCALSPSFLEGGYEMVGATKNNVDIFYNPVYFPSCKRDDILTIFADYHYLITENSDSCSPPRYEVGQWVLQDSVFTMNNKSFFVRNFSCVGFELQYTDSTSFGRDVFVLSYIKR